MKHLSGAIITVLGIILISGCASTPTTSGYLSDYDRLQPGQYLEQYWSDTNLIKRTDSPEILLGRISVDKISDKKGISVADCIASLESGLEGGGIVSGDNNDSATRIDLAITYMDPGSAAKRIWAGELGAGHAQVQIEGQIIDTQSGRLLAAFAERRSSSGAIGIKDIGGDSGPGLVAHMIKSISDDLNNELLVTFSSTPVQ